MSRVSESQSVQSVLLPFGSNTTARTDMLDPHSHWIIDLDIIRDRSFDDSFFQQTDVTNDHYFLSFSLSHGATSDCCVVTHRCHPCPFVVCVLNYFSLSLVKTQMIVNTAYTFFYY